MNIDPDRLAGRLNAAIERGEITDQEAREEWLAAEEQAEMELREAWRYGY